MKFIIYVWKVEPSGTELADKVTLVTQIVSTDWNFISKLYVLLISTYKEYRITIVRSEETQKTISSQRSSFDPPEFFK